jgi:ornithine cyclodeaminase/alanine dehydrogenase-like protein (mu-crystallin family)
MTALVLSAEDVRELLDLDRLVDALEAAMIDLSAGLVSMPPRVAAQVADRHATLFAMPAYLPSANALTTKLVSLFPENREQPSHQALICCFDPDTGTPLAVMDGTYITATRTAAGSALATRHLARADAEIVAVIGTGVQARSHAHAMSRIAGVRAIRIAGRDAAKVDALVGAVREDGLPVEAADSIEAAVRDADVVCAATHPQQPVVLRAWLKRGTHVNSVGYNSAGTGEVDGDVLRDARVVVESRAAVLAEPPSGAVEIHRAIDAGLITADELVELGEVCAGRAPGRADDEQLTFYKSVGVAAQDAAAASLVLAAARHRGRGIDVQL